MVILSRKIVCKIYLFIVKRFFSKIIIDWIRDICKKFVINILEFGFGKFGMINEDVWYFGYFEIGKLGMRLFI